MLIATTAKVLSGIPKMGGDRRGGGGRRWRRWWINRGCVKDKRGRKWEGERQREGGRINNTVYSLHIVSCPGHIVRTWLESEAIDNRSIVGIGNVMFYGFHPRCCKSVYFRVI